MRDHPGMIAARKLDPFITPPVGGGPERDPVLLAFLQAPVSDEPETEEERAAFEEGMEDVRAGRTSTHEEALAGARAMEAFDGLRGG